MGAAGAAADAIDFTGGNSSLILGTSPATIGVLNGGLGVTGTLTLMTPASTTLANVIHDGAGGAGALIFDSTSTLTLAGNNTYSGGTTIEVGTLDLGVTTSAGSGTIAFAPATGGSAALDLETGAQSVGGTFMNTLTNFNAAGETLDLKGFAFNGVFAYASAGTSLTVTGGVGATQTETFTLSNGALAYTAQSDGNGGTLITAVCFAESTRIRVARDGGEMDVPVEDLRVGDLAVTASGAARPITWLGHRRVDCRRHPAATRPVRIAAHAFGENRPARDLHLSPGHPVLGGADVDGNGGYLVPIMCLINGTTVRRVAVDKVTYWHVELDQHDILLAEGLPAESYIDLGSRPWFSGADGALYDPDMSLPGMPGRCRPVAVDGPVVEAERQRLDIMFAVRLAAAAAWPVAEDALVL